MKIVIYLAACWPLVAIITGAILCRAIHQGKVQSGEIFLA